MGRRPKNSPAPEPVTPPSPKLKQRKKAAKPDPAPNNEEIILASKDDAGKEFKIRVVNSALVSVDLSDYGFYVIVEENDKKFIGFDFRSDLSKIICHIPIAGSSKTKEYEYNLDQFITMLASSKRATAADKKAKIKSVTIDGTK